MVNVRLKFLHKDAEIPSYSKDGDAGQDLTAVRVAPDKYGNMVCYTGLAIEIPDGYVGLIFPRSSVSKKTLDLANAVGIIDSGYRGEIICKFKPTPQFNTTPMNWETFELETIICDDKYKAGDRVAQIIILPYPQVDWTIVSELSDTDRGAGGFGSTN